MTIQNYSVDLYNQIALAEAVRQHRDPALVPFLSDDALSDLLTEVLTDPAAVGSQVVEQVLREYRRRHTETKVVR